MHQRGINGRVRAVSLLRSVLKVLRVQLLKVAPLFLCGGVVASMREVLCMHHYIDPSDINNPNRPAIQSFIYYLFPSRARWAVMLILGIFDNRNRK